MLQSNFTTNKAHLQLLHIMLCCLPMSEAHLQLHGELLFVSIWQAAAIFGTCLPLKLAATILGMLQ